MENTNEELEVSIEEYKKVMAVRKASTILLQQRQNQILMEIRNRYAKVINSIDADAAKVISETIPMDVFVNSTIKLNNDTFIIENKDKTHVDNVDKSKGDLYDVIKQIHNQVNAEIVELIPLLEKTKIEKPEEMYEQPFGEIYNTYYDLILRGSEGVKTEVASIADKVIENLPYFKIDGNDIIGKIQENNKLIDITITEDGTYKDLYIPTSIALDKLAINDLVFVPDDITYQNPKSLNKTPITVTGEKAIKVAAEDVKNLSSDNEIEPISEIPPLVSLEEKRESEILGDKLGIKELSKYDSIESIKDDIYNILKDFPCDYNKKLDLIKCNTLNFPRKEQTKLRNHIFDVENEKGKLKVYKKTVIKVCSISRTLLGTPLYTVGQVFKWIKNPINRAGIPYLGSTENFFKKHYKKWKLKRGMKLLKRPEIIGKDKNKETKVNSENKEPEIKPENKETKVNSENKEPEIKSENQQKPADKKYINLLDNTCRVLEQDNLDDNKKIDMEGLKKSLDKFGISMDSYKEFSARRQQKSITNYINEKHIKAFTDDLHEKTEKNREKVIAETNKKIAEEFKAAEELKRLEMMKNSLNSVKSPNIGMNPYLREEIMAAKKTHVAPLETNNNQLPTNFKSELDQLFEQPVEEKGKSK